LFTLVVATGDLNRLMTSRLRVSHSFGSVKARDGHCSIAGVGGTI
jgi:hypothetical protein